MKLKELVNTKHYDTDKNSIHSYIDHLYSDLFEDKKHINSMLEIGVYDGGSILLWKDYFSNAKITGIDINLCKSISNIENIKHICANAYDENLISQLDKYDIIIDDGPHTIESMKFFIQNYTKLLNNNGIAIIEDIQDISWFEVLIPLIPHELSYEIVDLRHIKNRYDDLLLIMRTNNV